MTIGELRPPARWNKPVIASLIAIGLSAVGLVAFSAPASAAAYENSVGLGTAGAYSVLGGQTVTNTGAGTNLSGSLGVDPGNTATGFTPTQIGGATNLANAASLQAQNDLTTAYNAAASRGPGANIGAALVGNPATPLLPGVYTAASALDVSGAVTLDGQGDPNAVFIFQVGSALTTATGTSIVLTGAAQACNVFWQVATSATLQATNTFVGTIMSLASITINNGTTVAGRALARTAGQVTLINDVFTSAACATTPTTTTVTATPGTTGATSTLTATVTATGANAPTGTVTFSSNGTPLGTVALGANGVATLTIPAGTTAGTQSITAHFNGLLNYGVSTSTATNLVTTTAIDTTSTPLLASTGPHDTIALTLVAASLLLMGVALLIAGRRRGAAQHLSIDTR